jgi:hypothetical protein
MRSYREIHVITAAFAALALLQPAHHSHKGVKFGVINFYSIPNLLLC